MRHPCEKPSQRALWVGLTLAQRHDDNTDVGPTLLSWWKLHATEPAHPSRWFVCSSMCANKLCAILLGCVEGHPWLPTYLSTYNHSSVLHNTSGTQMYVQTYLFFIWQPFTKVPMRTSKHLHLTHMHHSDHSSDSVKYSFVSNNISNCMKEVTWLSYGLCTNGHRSAALGWPAFILPPVFVHAAVIRSW